MREEGLNELLNPIQAGVPCDAVFCGRAVEAALYRARPEVKVSVILLDRATSRMEPRIRDPKLSEALTLVPGGLRDPVIENAATFSSSGEGSVVVERFGRLVSESGIATERPHGPRSGPDTV
jgi:hypothetical protein